MEEYSHEIKSESCNPLTNSLTNLSLIGGQQFFSPFQISDGLFDLLFQSWIFFQLKIIKSTFQKSFHQAYRLKGKNRWIIKQNEVSVPPFSSPSVRALYLVFSIPQQELSCASFLDAASVLTEGKHIQYRQRDQSLQTIDSTAYFCLLSSTVFLWKDVHFTWNYRKNSSITVLFIPHQRVFYWGAFLPSQSWVSPVLETSLLVAPSKAPVLARSCTLLCHVGQ